MPKQTKKVNDTAIRALEFLKILTAQNCSAQEILEQLFKTETSDCELRKDVIYKYINTFSILGVDFTKTNKLFEVEKSPFTTKITQKEVEGLKIAQLIAEQILTDEEPTEFDSLLKNICKQASNITLKDIKPTQKEIENYEKELKINVNKTELSQFKKLCTDKQKLSFKYFNRQLNEIQKFTIEPQEIIVTPMGNILKAYNPEVAELQNFYIEDISEVKQLPSVAAPTKVKSTVTFALLGRLASAYELKVGEKIVSSEPNYKVIANREEDKSLLLLRLLRYGKACKIISPKSFRQKFLATIDKIKENYK